MKLTVYKGYDEFDQVGTLTISFNRITHVDISYSVITPIGTAEKYALYITRNKELPKTHYNLNQDTEYPFTIKKISKANFAYRNGKLSHEIISNDLFKYFNTKLFIKPSFIQRLRLTYNLKKFYWQTSDFKTHIFKYVIASLIGSILTILITNLINKPSPSTSNNVNDTKTDTLNMQTIPLQSTDTQTHQTIHKTEKSLNVSSSKDTAQQKDTTHKLQ